MSRNRWKFSKPTIAIGVFGLAVGLLAGLTVLIFGQQRGRMADPRDSLHVPTLTFGPQGPEELQGLPDDWSHHHLVFSDPGTEQEAVRNGAYEAWLRIVNDPRYIVQQLKRRSPAQGPAADYVARMNELARAPEAPQPEELGVGHLQDFFRIVRPRPVKPPQGTIKRDWNEALGTTTAPSYLSYPAKWSFSTTSASCAGDFVIYPTGQAGSSTQASIIAYYNLYSGCTTGTVPEVDWAYNTGGTVALAPVFSITGSQIAFVQTSSSVASLVLLRFPLTPPGTGTLSSPIAPTSESSASAYYNSGAGCTAPCMTSITFSGSPNDTLSNPYYDYPTDSLYVGAANGTLHKFNPVFNGIPAEVTSSGWPLTLNSSNPPSSPVYDSTSGCVFVGDVSTSTSATGGYFYSVESGNVGSQCTSTTASKHGTSSQLDIGWGIRDAPLVDPSAGEAYVFAGYDSSDDSGVFQFATSFTSGKGTEATLGTGGSNGKTTAYQLAGTFDNTYYTSTTASSPTGYIYVCGTGLGGTLYQVPISSNVMGTVKTGPMLTYDGSSPASSGQFYGRCSPITEFYNSSTDYIIFSVFSGDLSPCTGTTGSPYGGCVMSFNVTTPSSFSSSLTPLGGLNTTAIEYAVPTGGIIVDNALSSPTGTSQIYFLTTDASGTSPCTGICAVQASQSAP